MNSTFKIILVSLISFSNITLNAQEGLLKISQKRNADRTISFNFEKKDPGTHTIVLTFTNLANAFSSSDGIVVKNYGGNLLTLQPINKDQPITYDSYKYSYIRGKLNPKFDPDFVYLLPYKNGVKMRTAEVGFVGAKYFGNTTPADWKVYRFYTPTQDTVTTIRKGLVVDVKDQFEQESADIAFSNKTNEVTIEHADGTLATYKGFKKGSIKVEVGQTLLPGTSLGLNKEDSNGRFNVAIAIIYLKSNDFEATKNQNLQNSKSMYGFVTPHFATAENSNLILENKNEYTALQVPEVVKRELTKKELKTLGIK